MCEEGPEAKGSLGIQGCEKVQQDPGEGLGVWQGSQRSFCAAHKGSHVKGFKQRAACSEARFARLTQPLAHSLACWGGQVGEAQRKLELVGGDPGVQARGKLAWPKVEWWKGWD